MNEKNHCPGCTLHLCKNNKNKTEEYLRKMHNQCIVDLIGSERPIECGCFCTVKNNEELPKKFEKLVQEFQIAEGNTPCFQLAVNCNKRGR